MVGGIYRHTRNPKSLGTALAYVTLAVVRFDVIRREEACLGIRFGADYADYCARVRRWF